MKLYVAGPMRGYPAFNFPAFDRATKKLRKQGHVVFNPAERDRQEKGFNPKGMTGFENLGSLGFSLREALGADTEWICREAEGIYVLDGWNKSKGAVAEVYLARALGLPVLYDHEFGLTEIVLHDLEVSFNHV